VGSCTSTINTEVFSPEVAAPGPPVHFPVSNQLHFGDSSAAATQVYRNGSMDFHVDPLLLYPSQIWGDTLLFEQRLTNGAFVTHDYGMDMDQPQSRLAYSGPCVLQVGWCPNAEPVFPCNDQAMIPVSAIHLLCLQSAWKMLRRL
jgi:hypothetical protein